MADTQHIVCPHCAATNRVAAARRAEAVCGACKARLFDGAPHETDEAGFDLGAYPRVERWLKHVMQQPGFVPMRND